MASKLDTAFEHLTAAVSLPRVNTILSKLNLDPHARSVFSDWQVEVLLNQAQELLERCQRERTQYDDLRVKTIITSIDFFAEESELALQEGRVGDGTTRLAETIEKLERTANDKYVASQAEGKVQGWDDTINALHGAESAAVKADSNGVARWSTRAEKNLRILERVRQLGVLDAQTTRVALAKKDWQRLENSITSMRTLRDMKSEAITNPDGALNYKERYEALEAQIAIDFLDAYARLGAARDGMARLFGYGANGEPDLPDGHPPLETLVAWTRLAISWLVRFGHREQTFSVSISLRKSIGEAEWTRVVGEMDARSVSNVAFSYSIGPPLNGYLYVRTVGISAVAVGDGFGGRLALSIRYPEHALSQQRTGAKLDWLLIDQEALPSAYLGRVEASSSNRAPEIVGTISLKNASPISADGQQGHWKVQIAAAGGSLKGLSDIYLELNVSGTPRP
jgi:hypothetical protein